MDNIEKAHETRDLNISGASRGVWLVKVSHTNHSYHFLHTVINTNKYTFSFRAGNLTIKKRSLLLWHNNIEIKHLHAPIVHFSNIC